MSHDRAPNIAYVTSFFPFGTAESWTLGEIGALKDAGARIVLIPRSRGTRVSHRGEAGLLGLTVATDLFTWAVFMATLRTVFTNPRLVSGAIRIAWSKSLGVADFFRGLAVLPETFRLAEMLRDLDIDHVHGYSTTTVAVVASVLARALDTEFSFTLHSNNIIHKQYRRMFRALLGEAAFARLVAGDGFAPLSRLFSGKYDSKIKAIHLGVCCENGYSEPGAANDPFILVTPAGLSARKGHMFAVQAAKELLDRGFSSFRWLCYGEGPLRAELLALADAQGVGEHITFPGYLNNDNLQELFRLRRCDCVVLPSISLPPSEGIPHSLMQAMSYAIPVIATNCGSIPELVKGGAGILVPERNAGALADAILQLARNDDLRRQCGIRGREVVLAEFNEKKIAAELLDAFVPAAERSQPGWLGAGKTLPQLTP
jgi:glycosyltransferase involved in cell wall biosynthesis